MNGIFKKTIEKINSIITAEYFKLHKLKIIEIKIKGIKIMKKILLVFVFILFFANNVFAFGVLNPPYNQSDPNFNTLAMRVYNSGSPYTYTHGAYTYNALPITTTMSGCKLISIIRRTQGFPKPAYWAVENYKICSGNIAE